MLNDVLFTRFLMIFSNSCSFLLNMFISFSLQQFLYSSYFVALWLNIILTLEKSYIPVSDLPTAGHDIFLFPFFISLNNLIFGLKLISGVMASPKHSNTSNMIMQDIIFTPTTTLPSCVFFFFFLSIWFHFILFISPVCLPIHTLPPQDSTAHHSPSLCHNQRIPWLVTAEFEEGPVVLCAVVLIFIYNFHFFFLPEHL